MADREKVIRGLECCNNDECDSCPYYRSCDENDLGTCRATLHRDALALLNAQEPRVKTLEEVKAYLNSPDGDKKPLWLEWSTIPALSGWVLPSQVADLMKHYLEFYNVNWRPWTSRPTDEQRKKEPWNG